MGCRNYFIPFAGWPGHGLVGQPEWMIWNAAILRAWMGWVLCMAFWVATLAEAHAHSGDHASVHDTVAGIVQRLRESPSRSTVEAVNRGEFAGLLTADEQHALATGQVTFQVDTAVEVTVFRDHSLEGEPFWLTSEGWEKLPMTAKVGEGWFEGWRRRFAAGRVGLGVNSLRGGGRHYFVTVAGVEGVGEVTIRDLYPANLRTATMGVGVAAWADRAEVLTEVPESQAGRLLIQTLHGRRDDARLSNKVRWTRHPSKRRPDHVVLTWSGDPSTTQTFQWRTSQRTPGGALLFIEADQQHRPRREWHRVEAVTQALVSLSTANDPEIHRHTVELAGLRPATRYVYRVGTGTSWRWSEAQEFVTAPAEPAAFSFIYMGDAQNGLDTWGRLVRGAFEARPDVAFYLMAGDLVDRGNERDDWDDFFANAESVFNRRPLVPVIGNHECQGGHPRLYLEQFALPRNGPEGLEAERAYSFQYGNALFVILDSNAPLELQTEWLDRTLGASGARWKIVSYHHPVISSAPNRDNAKLRELWTPIFDRHGVDLALQGHDHAYLRTHPMRNGQPQADLADGTTYIVSVSGTKMYTQASRPETLVGFTDVATWQVLDLAIEGDRLTYRSYDHEGGQRDTFVIDKTGRP